jgi:hypothetical protein
MRRIDPAFPDLLPVSHRLGAPPVALGRVMLDPVEMNLCWPGTPAEPAGADRNPPRRPAQVLVHAQRAAQEREYVALLVRAGCGVLLFLDDALAVNLVPEPLFAGQIVVLAPWLPPFWGGDVVPGLQPWRERALPAGVLLALAPAPQAPEVVDSGVEEAEAAGAEFVVACPLSLPAEDRHRTYDAHAGADGNAELEDLLFHSDIAVLAFELEREASRQCRSRGLGECVRGPATALASQGCVTASSQLLLWARRLDLLDGLASTGWQLRRAARALLASRRDPATLLAEDNLRIVPGFTPWVEAFARAVWGSGGEPFDEVLGRWIGQ